MSRIGIKPVAVLDGVKVAIEGQTVKVEGPLGKLEFSHRPEVSVELSEDGKQLVVVRQSDDRAAKAFHGLTRSLIQNMVDGVKTGYEKRLEVVGVGYVCSLQGKTLSLRVGFANEIKKTVPDGLDVSCPDQTHVVVKGCDKQLVGQFAAEVRAARKPEPYKGKGVRYEGEHVKLKPGKAAAK
ncbi:MAG: 50S ribosomal protein L6 [Planctomycetota bacterium]|jgi:large subunit ribosomal protein L6|nr:50S ribosomal protein L6 [Planctomycetota bacterium]MEC7716487.1 50S ribosomal protein L6 [Planctomycetota bacterium]MEC8240935.1 50S ribosomal protein L6 [Planctomycetota bacterium]MEC8433713.1 50S ribosomal protein L6 [Planctomycetota bacterium]MEC8591372.1 50S ribosomal protein L6 [Planctomycetota bacterium]